MHSRITLRHCRTTLALETLLLSLLVLDAVIAVLSLTGPWRDMRKFVGWYYEGLPKGERGKQED